MVDWTITDLSNVMDKSIGYVCVLAEMRQFVQNNAVGHLDINIHQTAGAATLTTTLRMSHLARRFGLSRRVASTSWRPR